MKNTDFCFLVICCYSVIGYEVSAPGVEQYKEFIEEAKHEKDEVIEHSYYQWVGVVLFLQALTFYISHLFWKIWEKSKCFFVVVRI